MPAEIHQEFDGQLVVCRGSGRLNSKDAERFFPAIERLIEQSGTTRVLFEMHDFHGWTDSGLWQDIKFSLKHFRDIERIAMVGEKKWQAATAVISKPFTAAEIRYFDRNNLDEARAWVEEDLE